MHSEARRLLRVEGYAVVPLKNIRRCEVRHLSSPHFKAPADAMENYVRERLGRELAAAVAIERLSDEDGDWCIGYIDVIQ